MHCLQLYIDKYTTIRRNKFKILTPLGVLLLQSDRSQEKYATLFTIHDLVHDLAKEILSHQLNTGGNKCRYASLTDCSKSLQFLVNFPANTKALSFQDCAQQELCGVAFSSAKCL